MLCTKNGERTCGRAGHSLCMGYCYRGEKARFLGRPWLNGGQEAHNVARTVEFHIVFAGNNDAVEVVVVGVESEGQSGFTDNATGGSGVVDTVEVEGLARLLADAFQMLFADYHDCHNYFSFFILFW